jgi:hypothetical protein
LTLVGSGRSWPSLATGTLGIKCQSSLTTLYVKPHLHINRQLRLASPF